MISSLLRAHDYLVVVQETAYTFKEMKVSLAAHTLQLDEASFETPGAIGTVERCHAPLRLAFERFRADFARMTTDQDCLDTPVFAINCTVGAERRCPALFAFGAIPRPARTILALIELEKVCVIELATKAVKKEQARRRIAFGLRHKGNMKGMESQESFRNVPAGVHVFVYRTAIKTWKECSRLSKLRANCRGSNKSRTKNIPMILC